MEQKKPSARFEFLDALRGIAILGVLSTHCAWFSGGEFPGKTLAFAGLYGVQLFFVVSAFTIFLTLERAAARESALIRGFFIRRVMRIAPMFWIGILIYAFLPGREHYYANFSPGISHYTLTALLLHGWHPLYCNSVVPGGWTIADEMSFYLLAPFLFFVIKNWRHATLLLVASLGFAWIANNAMRVATNHQFLFAEVPNELLRQFSSKWFPSQLPVFACGILSFYLVKALPQKYHTKQNGLMLLGISITWLLGVVGASTHVVFLLPLAFALGFLLLMLGLAIYPVPLIVNFALRFLGRISYSFYLLHFVFLEWEIKFLRAHYASVFDQPLLAYLVLSVVTLAIVSPASFITWHLIEQPFIKLGLKLAKQLSASSEKSLAAQTGFTPAQN